MNTIISFGCKIEIGKEVTWLLPTITKFIAIVPRNLECDHATIYIETDGTYPKLADAIVPTKFKFVEDNNFYDATWTHVGTFIVGDRAIHLLKGK